jgi:hypothetical protein
MRQAQNLETLLIDIKELLAQLNEEDQPAIIVYASDLFGSEE